MTAAGVYWIKVESGAAEAPGKIMAAVNKDLDSQSSESPPFNRTGGFFCITGNGSEPAVV